MNDWREIWSEEHRRISGVTDDGLLASLSSIVSEALEQGLPYRDVEQKLRTCVAAHRPHQAGGAA